jgi:folate-binding protein YgfZ
MTSSERSLLGLEYQALRSDRALVELGNWSSISVTGTDREAFLHNFCTNDVKRLVPGTSCEAFFCNVKGKVIGHGSIDCRDDELAIIGVPGQNVALIQHLDRYIIREDVQLRDATSERCYLLVTGQLPAGLTSKLISWNVIGRSDSALVELDAKLAKDCIAELTGSGFLRVRAEVFEAARIEAGFPFFGIDFNGENLPQEVGRDFQAISFEKGCYLGQETVARIDALGHVNQKLVGIRFPGGHVPDRGVQLTFSLKNVGSVTSAALSPSLGAPLALAMVRREANAIGTKLNSTAGECEVVALPIVAR